MARPLSHGTPSRTKRYLTPGRSRLALLSAAVGLFALTVGVGLHLAGLRRVASPGDVAGGHAAIDLRCAQCHQPARAARVDLRCERCHDPIDSRRYGTAAHALVNGGDAWHAAKAAPETCAACHVEHRGPTTDLRAVDDRKCAACHDFGSFRRHPEFAAVRAQRGPDEGMDFSHATHLTEIAKEGSERCASCHQPTMPDLRGYEPIAFDTHCVRCHIKNNGLTLNGTNFLASTPTFGDMLLPGTPAAPAPQLSEPDGRGRVTFERVRHGDPWVMANANRLTRTIDPAGWARERARLVAERARLIAIANTVPLSGQSDADLAVWRDALRQEIAQGGGERAAADPSTAAIASQLAALQKPAVVAATAAAASDAASVEARKQELQQLLDAVAARTTGPLAARAEKLTKQLAGISSETKTATAADLNMIAERLHEVDSALRNAAPVLRGDVLASIEAARDAVRQQLTGTLDQAAYDARRLELIGLAATLAAGGDPAGRARVAELRAAILALPDRPGAVVPVDRALDKQRLLDLIEIELDVRRDPSPMTASGTTNTERAAARGELQTVARRIAELDAMPAPIPGADPGRARSALRGVLGPCLQCHEATEDETRLRRTALNGPVMPASVFSHKPHTAQAACDSCHSSITTSRAGADLNVPGVATCQSCHRPTQTRSSCATCHTYHAPSAAKLTVARWP